MSRRDVTLPDGARVVCFETPCGFEFYLTRRVGGAMKVQVQFGGEPAALVNSELTLSPAGALMLASEIRNLYEA